MIIFSAPGPMAPKQIVLRDFLDLSESLGKQVEAVVPNVGIGLMIAIIVFAVWPKWGRKRNLGEINFSKLFC